MNIDNFICGDAKELAHTITDNSVDLVFTDPVYDRICDYTWLAETALRVLNPGKSLLAWCGSIQQYEIQPLMARYLKFVMPLTYTKIAKTYRLNAYRVFHWTTPVLWFIKPSDIGTTHDHKQHDWFIDTCVDVDTLRTYTESNAVVSTNVPPKDSYKWHKNPEAYRKWLDALSQPGDVVYDPFGGSGSLPVLCIQTGRHFISCEIDPEVARSAQERIASTQRPHNDLITQASLAL